MNSGRTVFAQLMDHLPAYEFRKCVERYRGDRRLRGFSCWDQFLALAFAQLTYRESLRDIEVCLRSVQPKLYHVGFRGKVSRSTLADADQAHDWRIYADFAQTLIGVARPLYADEPLGFDLDGAVYALDSTTIDLCLSVFPWARFRSRKAAVKMHTLLDVRGSIPTFIEVSEGKIHDVNILDQLLPEAGSFYVMDRAYVDFQRLHVFQRSGAFFVVRVKKGVQLRRRCSHPADAGAGVISDHTVVLTTERSAQHYPDTLRRVRYHDVEHDRRLSFLTNNFDLPALTVALLYKSRWKVELFFKWIKQHLRIKAFYGTSENAVKTQIWTAVSVYVLVAILKKRLGLGPSLGPNSTGSERDAVRENPHRGHALDSSTTPSTLCIGFDSRPLSSAEVGHSRAANRWLILRKPPLMCAPRGCHMALNPLETLRKTLTRGLEKGSHPACATCSPLHPARIPQTLGVFGSFSKCDSPTSMKFASIVRAFHDIDSKDPHPSISNQLILFDL